MDSISESEDFIWSGFKNADNDDKCVSIEIFDVITFNSLSILKKFREDNFFDVESFNSVEAYGNYFVQILLSKGCASNTEIRIFTSKLFYHMFSNYYISSATFSNGVHLFLKRAGHMSFDLLMIYFYLAEMLHYFVNDRTSCCYLLMLYESLKPICDHNYANAVSFGARVMADILKLSCRHLEADAVGHIFKSSGLKWDYFMQSYSIDIFVKSHSLEFTLNQNVSKNSCIVFEGPNKKKSSQERARRKDLPVANSTTSEQIESKEIHHFSYILPSLSRVEDFKIDDNVNNIETKFVQSDAIPDSSKKTDSIIESDIDQCQHLDQVTMPTFVSKAIPDQSHQSSSELTNNQRISSKAYRSESKDSSENNYNICDSGNLTDDVNTLQQTGLDQEKISTAGKRCHLDSSQYQAQGNRRIINASTEDLRMRRSENAYIPNFMRPAGSKSLNKMDQLWRNLKSIFNKITPQNFEACFDELLNCKIENENEMIMLVEILFSEAVKNAVKYAATFAMLCDKLAFLKVTVQDSKCITFKSLLVTQCQKMFETSFDQQIASAAKKYDDLLKIEMDEEKRKCLEEDRENAKKKQMDCYFGNIRLIGELFIKNCLTAIIIHSCVLDLFNNSTAEAIKSVCILLEITGAKLQEPKAKVRIEQYIHLIKKKMDKCKDTRIKYMMMEVIDMKNRGWKLKKLVEERNEFKFKEMENELDCYTGLQFSKKPDLHQLQRELCNSGKLFGVKEYSRDTKAPPPDFALKCVHILGEFRSSSCFEKDTYKAIKFYEDYFIQTILHYSCDKNKEVRATTGKLLHFVLVNKLIRTFSFCRGVRLFLESSQDLLCDIPMFFEYLAEILTWLLTSDVASSVVNTRLLYDCLKPSIGTNIQDNVSCDSGIMVDIIKNATTRLGEKIVNEICRRCGICRQLSSLMTEGEAASIDITSVETANYKGGDIDTPGVTVGEDNIVSVTHNVMTAPSELSSVHESNSNANSFTDSMAIIGRMPPLSDALLDIHNKGEHITGEFKTLGHCDQAGDKSVSQSTVDEMDQLRRKLQSILNKITSQNFEACFDKLLNCKIENESELTTLVEVLFNKAVTEKTNSVTFATLCDKLSFLKVTVQNSKCITFKSLLLTKCQKIVETPFDQQTFDAVKKYLLENEINEKKRLENSRSVVKKMQMDYYFGNIRFIGELFMKNLLKANVIHSCVRYLLKNSTTEALESVCKLLEITGAKLFKLDAEGCMEEYMHKIREQMHKCKDTRIKFMLLEIMDKKNLDWTLRKRVEVCKIKPMIKNELEKESKINKQ